MSPVSRGVRKLPAARVGRRFASVRPSTAAVMVGRAIAAHPPAAWIIPLNPMFYHRKEGLP